ncbi:AtpZ/AtpI family protein [Paracoccus sp. p4-l81]|uniref:AtpZ/AtpI family protein n=1 Tax=unclassified Paracoccus (in: a-proteobacteria) TaxID=2688777 RepID=UPI0035B99710
MSESDADRLRRLEQRLAEIRQRDAPAAPKEDHFAQANTAWRMVIELVSGLGIGFAVGYGLDWLFGTTPWLLVIFILAGFAAGVKTMLGTAQEMARRQAGEGQQAAETAKDEGE